MMLPLVIKDIRTTTLVSENDPNNIPSLETKKFPSKAKTL